MAPLLDVRNLTTRFDTEDGTVSAVSDVSFVLDRGETVGIVGESGSGKSVTALSLMGLVPSPPGHVSGGQVLFDGRDLLRLSEREMRRLRGNRISMIFQDPITSLNPVLTIRRQLTESLALHQGLGASAARSRAVELLDLVGIPNATRRIDSYPHQFSGGMRQRVMIAMALSCDPELLIADEPTTALDVTIQAQILELIGRLKHELGTAVLMITHDLGVVAGMADRVIVMYAGRVVEEGPTDAIFAAPRMPYTLGLLQSLPRLDDPADRRLEPIPGQPPDLTALPRGCPLAPRCGYFTSGRCDTERPPLRDVDPGHRAACHFDIRTMIPVAAEKVSP